MRAIPLFFLLSLLIGCAGETTESNASLDKEYLKAQIILEKFFTPHFNGKKIIADGNTLIFGKSDPMDTSFVVVLFKDSTLMVPANQGHILPIYAYYYQITPVYHANLQDYIKKENEILYFDGYSFKIEPSLWTEIIEKSTDLFAQHTDTSYWDCLDCTHYTVLHNLQVKNASNNDSTLLNFERFIRQKFLYKIFKEKVTIGVRADKEIQDEKVREIGN
jgi:hypothetical protein